MRRRVRGSAEAESGCSTKSCGKTGGELHFSQSTGEFSTRKNICPFPNIHQYLISSDIQEKKGQYCHLYCLREKQKQKQKQIHATACLRVPGPQLPLCKQKSFHEPFYLLGREKLRTQLRQQIYMWHLMTWLHLLGVSGDLRRLGCRSVRAGT